MKRIKGSTLRWILAVSGRKKGYLVLLTLIEALASFLGVYYALLFKRIIDNAVGKNPAGFRRAVITMVCLVALELAIGAFNRWLYKQARSSVENTFKQRLFDNILRKDYSRVSQIHSGEWMNRLTNDAIVLGLEFVELLPGMVGTMVRMIAALVMVVMLEQWFVFLLLPGGLIILVLNVAFKGLLKRLFVAIQESDGRLRIFLQERIGSLMMIKSFAAEEQTGRKAAEKMNEHKAARMNRLFYSNIFSTSFGGILQAVYLAGVVYCAGGIMNGTITYGTLTAIMQLISQVQMPFANLSGYLPRFYSMCASAERLMEVESFPDDEPALDAQTIRQFYQNDFRCLGLKDVSFAYRSEEAPVVLEHFTMEIRKGEIVAFTGHSGCGKSTVLRLLMCMYPLEKGLRYMGSRDGGQTLTAAHRRMFAYVPQGNALMAGSIREIVSFADPGASRDDARMARALKIACADEFVDDVELVLGEKGTGLSEGQMQRIAIARAVFSDAPVLLLDEATSALDEATEKRLLENLRSLTDKTVIIVTHRKAALEICSRVLHFTENGVEE